MSNIRNVFIQISHTIFSNFIKLLVVGLLTIIVPKFISLEQYGYWQLYIFYTSYVGFFHLGWCDGIYLKEGGKDFNTINKSSYKTQFWSLIVLQLLISSIIIFSSSIFITELERIYVIYGTCINACLSVSCTLLAYLMQSTGRIKEYSFITIIGRLIYFILVIVFLAFGFLNFKIIVIADLVGWSASLLYSMYVCRTIFKEKSDNYKKTIYEIFDNISVGSKLMIANIASTLIIGIVRINIENFWNIEVFGKVSLSLNLCNLVLIFINSVSIVLYPILKRINFKNLKSLYEAFDHVLLFFLIVSLMSFFPVKIFISLWLPQYLDSISYMAILFPICLYESKVSMLILTFLKVLREEKKIMITNVIILLLGCILSYITVYLFNNLVLSISIILLLLYLRCLALEFICNKEMKVRIKKAIFVESFFTVLFLFSNIFFSTAISFLVYSIICTIIVFFERKNIVNNILYLKKFLRNDHEV